MLEESQYFIEWTAAEAPAEMAEELVNLQVLLALWRLAWPEAQNSPLHAACWPCRRSSGPTKSCAMWQTMKDKICVQLFYRFPRRQSAKKKSKKSSTRCGPTGLRPAQDQAL